MKPYTFPEQVGGFTVVPVALNDDKKSPIYHVIYLKKNEARQRDEDDDMDTAERTIYAVNLPVSTTLEHIKALCQDISGAIVEAFIPEAGNRGQIILVDKASCVRLISKAKKLHKLEKEPLQWPQIASSSGYQKYLEQGLDMFPDPQDLIDEVNNFMKAYNEAEERERMSRKSKEGYVDEDGFTLVTGDSRGGSKASIAARAAETQERLKKELEKRNKKREMPDFYRFQIREKKKRATNDLLKKFNEDKAKIMEMREKNKFKPYWCNFGLYY